MMCARYFALLFLLVGSMNTVASSFSHVFLETPTDSCTDPPLHTAIVRNQTEIVKDLILNGEDLYEENCEGLRPMELAIKANNEDMIKILVSFKFDFRSRNRFGDTVLHTAVTFGKTKVLQWFIEEKLSADLDAVNKKNETPLFLSVLLRNGEAFESLVKNGANVTLRLPGGDTYVHHSAKIANVRTLLAFVALNVSIEGVNGEDETALSVAVRKDRPALINVILSQGADFGRRNAKGDTYIHVAVKYGSGNALRTLLRRHALIDEENFSRETPMNIAVQMNRIDAIKLLLNFGADLRKNCTQGRSYVHIAVKNESTEALRLLLKSRIPVDVKDSKGHTPSFLAVSSDYLEGLKVLKEFGASLNLTWPHSEWGVGMTLLHEAAASGSVASIKWLVSQGVSVNSTTDLGSTALHVATENGRYEAVEALLDLGVCVNCLVNGFASALRIAEGRPSLKKIAKLIASRGGTWQL